MYYDVIIVGANFAGLAVAAQLHGRRVLLLDRHPVGTVQTSACGTPVATLRALGLDSAIQQIHDRLVVHSGARTYVYPVDESFCTFDYGHLCRILRERSEAEFVQATVLGREGGRVRSSVGTFSGGVVVDASGWRAVLANPGQANRRAEQRLNFGLETTVDVEGEGLHFWYDPGRLLPFGIGWSFPCGSRSRVGVGSYRGDSHLVPALKRLLDGMGKQRGALHGGYFPFELREPVAGETFLVGDAAGQCLGLTGEGIRPALYFGTRLGHMLRLALEGSRSLGSVTDAYRKLVARYRPWYGPLSLAQRLLPLLPVVLAQALLGVVAQPLVRKPVLGFYSGAFGLPAWYPAGEGGKANAA
ncbi:MAG: NAD(P)/FAD-dependent oxidoreductase [Chloroflexota bacterium]